MAALQLTTQIDIQAPMATVWTLLTDWKHYPDWNPFIFQLKGTLALGERLEAHIDGMQFKPIVTHLEAPYHFAWLGKLWIRGLFDGAHSFRLEALPDGGTRFYHEESFKGILVPLLKKQLLGKTKMGFEQMNQALKDRAEQV